MQVAYRALLESMTPPICGDTTWPQIRRLLWNDPVFIKTPDGKRREIFEEFREIVRDLDAFKVCPQGCFEYTMLLPMHFYELSLHSAHVEVAVNIFT